MEKIEELGRMVIIGLIILMRMVRVEHIVFIFSRMQWTISIGIQVAVARDAQYVQFIDKQFLHLRSKNNNKNNRIMKKSLLFLLFVSMIGWQARAEMSLVVRPITDTDKITALYLMGKLVYSGDSLYLYDKEQVLIYGEELAKVQHVRYSDEVIPIEVGSENTKNTMQITVYPNPTSDKLYINNLEAGAVRLYTADGQLLQIIETKESTTEVDMSPYPTGTYVFFCSGKAFSVIKR